MSELQVRPLVLRRHPNLKGCLVLCDEETGALLGGLSEVKMNSSFLGGPATITATFQVIGPEGVRLFGDDARSDL